MDKEMENRPMDCEMEKKAYGQGEEEQTIDSEKENRPTGQVDGEQGYGLGGKVQVYEQGIIEIVHAREQGAAGDT